MLTQHYKLKATPEHIENALPGQFVFESNDDNTVIGFIDFVSDCEIAIMLFGPKEISDDIGAINIAEECDFYSRLTEIFDENPDMGEMWREELLKAEVVD